MLAPVIHYLLEALRTCAQVADLPPTVLAMGLLGVTALLLAVLKLRTRVTR